MNAKNEKEQSDRAAEREPAQPPSDRPGFDWLWDPRGRRGALRDVEAAVRAGWLDGPAPEDAARRAALIDVLCRLSTDPATPPREMIRSARILMGAPYPGFRSDHPPRITEDGPNLTGGSGRRRNRRSY